MKIKFFFCLLSASMCCFALTSAFALAKTSSLSDFFESKYKNSSTLQADFTQKQKNIILGGVRETSGVIFIQKPNSFRWETRQPKDEMSTLVVNAKSVIYYQHPFREGEKGQVSVQRAAGVQSKTAIDLLSGSADLKNNFDVKELEERKYQLKPLKSAADVEKIDLFLEKSTNLVYKLILTHSTGKETEIELKNIRLNVPLKASLFQFKIPPNTNKME